MTEAEVGGTLAMASWDCLPRELAVLAVNEMAGNAGALKGGTNDGTITEEVETGLPADGWATFAVGVEIMGTPPIAPGVKDIVSKVEVLACLATLAACTDWAIKATISGDRETPEDGPALAEVVDSPTLVDWCTGAATEADDSSNSGW